MFSSSSRTPTVLAVDDCAITQRVIHQVLGDRYRVLVASNAKEALNLIYKHQIDVLLLDISMPDIDGFALCRTVRQIPQFERLPIVMLTARKGVFDRVQSQMAGATEYLTKPFSAESLDLSIQAVLNSTSTTTEDVR